MGKFVDLTGQRFGRLVVVAFAETGRRGQSRWRCRCDCGGEKTLDGGNFVHGNTKSCGCIARKRNHGGRKAKDRLYNIWCGMKQRANYPKHKDYSRYGGRGITVCDEWLNDFSAFREWALTNGYRDDLSIDRIDNDGNYEPSNCRWEDSETQGNNQRKCHRIDYGGERLTVSQWERKLGFKQGKIKARLYLGWTPEEALGFAERRKVAA